MHYVAILLLFLLTPCSAAHAWPARVVAVTDGDTLTVEPAGGGERVTIRLHGIDAPELQQPYGGAAKDFVIAKVLFKAVDVHEALQGRDRYGRVIATVLLPSGQSLQAALLQEGLAWVWPRYCKNCGAWQEVQAKAKAAGIGLWAAPEPVPPWQWRKRRK